MKEPLEVFFSYAHEDEKWKKWLETALSMLKREELITVWYDHKIVPGTEWKSEIEQHLNSAHIILLLVSPDFIASDYCWGKEVKIAMQRHTLKEAHVIPIIVRPIDWGNTPFQGLSVLPTDGKPLSRWRDKDEALLNVAKGIRIAINKGVVTSSEMLTHPLKEQRGPSSTAQVKKTPYQSIVTILSIITILITLTGMLTIYYLIQSHQINPPNKPDFTSTVTTPGRTFNSYSKTISSPPNTSQNNFDHLKSSYSGIAYSTDLANYTNGYITFTILSQKQQGKVNIETSFQQLGGSLKADYYSCQGTAKNMQITLSCKSETDQKYVLNIQGTIYSDNHIAGTERAIHLGGNSYNHLYNWKAF